MDMAKHKILVVDDELEFLELIKEFLEGEGYDVLTAESGEQGIEKLKMYSPISVIISDQKMGGMSGLEFLEFVKSNDPKTIRMLLSGDIDKDKMNKLVGDGDIFCYASKPIDLMTVLDNIASGIERYDKEVCR
jgi:response regulator RpfG family c-di-GMP phosphodiesterase